MVLVPSRPFKTPRLDAYDPEEGYDVEFELQ
jgi:hypothetical protein